MFQRWKCIIEDRTVQVVLFVFLSVCLYVCARIVDYLDSQRRLSHEIDSLMR